MAGVEAERVLLTRVPEETEELAAALGRLLPAGAVVTLDGELGSGKTCFVRGLARGLGTPEPVSSPTYTLMHEYRGGRLPLFHFDAWMSGREAAFLADGGAEALHADGVAVLEWGSRVAEYLPATRLEVRIEHAGERERRIRLRLLLARGAGRAGPDGGAEPAWEPVRAFLRAGPPDRARGPAGAG